MKNRIVMTGGGTAGHVVVNTVLIPRLIEMGWEVIYIGSYNGIEKQMISQIEGVTYYGISTGKLRRYFSKDNFKDCVRVLRGIYQAYKHLGRTHPNLIFSCGGFVSVPVVIAGWFRRIPSIIRETDYTVGLANKICIPLASKVCVTFPDTLKNKLPNIKRVECGPIIREELLCGEKEKGIQLAGLKGKKPIVLVQGGSQGAYRINTIVREALGELIPHFDIIHLCGRGNVNTITQVDGYIQYEYVEKELSHFYAAADLIVSRAGSNSVFEGMVLGKPMLLLPLSQRVSRGDQVLNAGYVERLGMGRVILDEELTSDKLVREIKNMYEHKHRFIGNKYKNSSNEGEEVQLKIINEYTNNNNDY